MQRKRGERMDPMTGEDRESRRKILVVVGRGAVPVAFHTVWVVLETPVLIGYARVSKADSSQSLDLQRDLCARPSSTGAVPRHVSKRRSAPA